jgi:tripartite-type tricarboxylate transporter receptor subunit TctC
MKTTLHLIGAALLMAVVSPDVAAQSAGGKRSVRVLTPAAPGGPGDVQIRILLPKLSESLGQTLIVDNRASSNGLVAMEIAAKAAPDGHTLAVGNSGTHAVNASLYRKLPYDPVRDFTAVSQFSTTGMLVAGNPRLPGTSIQDLAAHARGNPGKLNVAIAGATGELSGNALWSQLKVKLTNVNYKGSAPSTLAIVSGEADIALLTPLAIQTHVRSGKLKAYGVTSRERSPVLPEVPTMAEQGVTGYDFPYWNGLFVAAGTPESIVRTLHRALVNALEDPEVKERFRQLGLVTVGNTPQEFRAVVARDVEKYRKVIIESDIPRL